MLLGGPPLEHVEDFVARGRPQQMLDHALRLSGPAPRRLTNEPSSLLPVVVGTTKLNVGAQQRPVRADCPVRKADAAGVDAPPAPDASVDLHVGVAADDGRL